MKQLPFLALLLLSTLLISSCKKKNEEVPVTTVSDRMADYIYAYTSGVVSSEATIRLRFVNDAVGSEQIGQPVADGVFKLSPSAAGAAIWEDEKTIAFLPGDPLTPATNYTASVNVGKVFSDVKSKGGFSFYFKTQEPQYAVDIKGLQVADGNNPVNQVLIGTIHTSPNADKSKVKQLLEANYNGSKMPIEWEHTEDDSKHLFKVKDIKRGKEQEEIELKWDGESMSSSHAGSKTIPVPAMQDFKVMDVKVMHDKGKYLLVQFSDPLKASQDLNGLIMIRNYNGNIQFDIDGQMLRVYTSDALVGDKSIGFRSAIKNIADKSLGQDIGWQVEFPRLEPKVRLVGKGVIIPNSEGLYFPFEAMGLKYVEVEIHKIFNNNILQFLQTNALDNNGEMERVSRRIYRERVALNSLNSTATSNIMTRYALDLKDIISKDEQAIYQVIIGFLPGYTSESCSNFESDDLSMQRIQPEEEEKSLTNLYYGPDGYYRGYYNDRDNPCKPAFYTSRRFVHRNVFSSNIGLVAKSNDNHQMTITAADIRSAEPLSGVEIKVYDYQQQLLGSAATDNNGNATVDLEEEPFVVVAEKGSERGYLRLLDYTALPLSRFNIAGSVPQKGIKGYIYGDRGVWRPGDSVFLNFVIQNEQNPLPDRYPVTMELKDPRGQIQRTFVQTNNIGPIYPLHFATTRDAPTGNWTVSVSAGGATFNKTIKVETVKPNRLKVRLELDKDELNSGDKNLNAKLKVNWLHGAAASNLKADVKAQIGQAETSFSKFSSYKFTDPARELNRSTVTLFKGKLNEAGQAVVSQSLESLSKNAVGKLRINFMSRAFETGGDVSTGQTSVLFSPYSFYAGIEIPENNYGSKRLEIGKDGNVLLAAVNEDGQAASNQKLEIGLYRVNWRWWWEQGADNVSRYNSSQLLNSQKRYSAITDANGKASVDINVPTWGRYMLRVCNTQSGHCAGDYFYAGYPWYGDEGQSENSGASMLAFVSDKEKYNVGDEVKLTIPATQAGQCLVSLETGSTVLSSEWFTAKQGENTYTFTATKDMAPTVYANVTMLQPHAQTDNDLPIRMYGVIPIAVEDPKTRLSPELKIADKLEPDENFEVKVSEAEGKPMAYTIAIVDEGLLDLTGFKTPSPWDEFYAKEALGIKTWDIYDYVLGAFGGQMNSILSIGGDAAMMLKDENEQANRFVPVVMQAGPFYLEKGKKASHNFKMPNYVGSVRAMIVAADRSGAYGNSEKAVPVKKPLMILATLPRVLGPTEELTLPVNVFAMEERVKDVRVSVSESSGLVEFTNGTSRSLTFNRTGDDMTYFNVKVKDRTGVAKFTVTASSGSLTTSQEIEIEIRNPNPYITRVMNATLAEGETWNEDFMPLGVTGTNDATLEVSSIPPIELGRQLYYLLSYPHGCIEQTTSSGFPQLFVNKLIDLEGDQELQSKDNVIAAINRLKQFQLPSGGFEYWPGTGQLSDWGSSYAGHFLLEAKNQGYEVSNGIIAQWVKHQKEAAKRWDPQYQNRSYYSSVDMMQAYRLYTLALAGSPQLAAMNRLRKSDGLDNAAAWKLAAAYALAGKKQVAEEIVDKLGTEVKPYRELGYTYGSDLRDEAMILETLILLEDNNRAANLVQRIAKKLSANRWNSTQTIGYSLMAISKFAGDGEIGKSFTYAYSYGNSNMNKMGSSKPVSSVSLDVDKNSRHQLSITNESSNQLFVRLILHGQPLVGDGSSSQSELKIDVRYTDLKGNSIMPDKIKQGQDFVAEVKVTNPGSSIYRNLDEMALTQIFPSGWEIINSRMSNISGARSDMAEYVDIRDDRVYTYFDILAEKTKTYRVQLNAAYAGRYYMPSVACAAMYNDDIHAHVPGKWVEVEVAGLQ